MVAAREPTICVLEFYPVAGVSVPLKLFLPDHDAPPTDLNRLHSGLTTGRLAARLSLLEWINFKGLHLTNFSILEFPRILVFEGIKYTDVAKR